MDDSMVNQSKNICMGRKKAMHMFILVLMLIIIYLYRQRRQKMNLMF